MSVPVCTTCFKKSPNLLVFDVDGMMLLRKKQAQGAQGPAMIQSRRMLSFSGDHDGILNEDEFVNGLYELLHPTTKQGMTLAARIAKANLVQVSNLRFDI